MTKPWTCDEILDEGIDGAIETRAAGGAPIVPADACHPPPWDKVCVRRWDWRR